MGAAPEENPAKCDWCGQKDQPLMSCGRCKQARYCCKDCQRAHWKTHQTACNEHAASRSGSSASATTTDALQADRTSSTASRGSTGSKKKKKDRESKEETLEIAPIPNQVLYPYSKFLKLMKHPGMRCQAPVGLQNVGNTCFINSLLQCLLATQPLVAYFRSDEHEFNCKKSSPSAWCLLCEMQKLTQMVRDAQQGDVPRISPKNITGHIAKIKSGFSQGSQEDSHEAYVGMIEQMEAVLLHEAGGKAAVPDQRSQETTLMNHCFTSYMSCQMECHECGHISQRFDTMIELELFFQGRAKSLEDFFSNLFADETLEGENKYKCDKCAKLVDATRHCCMETLPNIMVVCFKRFTMGRYGKITRFVSYNDALDMAPYRSNTAIDDGPATYSLYGVLVHIDSGGSVLFGHYIAYIKTEDGRWWLCDDRNVQQVEASEALNQKAYMLFYQRDKPRAAADPGLRKKFVKMVPQRKVMIGKQDSSSESSSDAETNNMNIKTGVNGMNGAAAQPSALNGIYQSLVAAAAGEGPIILPPPPAVGPPAQQAAGSGALQPTTPAQSEAALPPASGGQDGADGRVAAASPPPHISMDRIPLDLQGEQAVCVDPDVQQQQQQPQISSGSSTQQYVSGSSMSLPGSNNSSSSLFQGIQDGRVVWQPGISWAACTLSGSQLSLPHPSWQCDWVTTATSSPALSGLTVDGTVSPSGGHVAAPPQHADVLLMPSVDMASASQHVTPGMQQGDPVRRRERQQLRLKTRLPEAVTAADQVRLSVWQDQLLVHAPNQSLLALQLPALTKGASSEQPDSLVNASENATKASSGHGTCNSGAGVSSHHALAPASPSPTSFTACDVRRVSLSAIHGASPHGYAPHHVASEHSSYAPVKQTFSTRSNALKVWLERQPTDSEDRDAAFTT